MTQVKAFCPAGISSFFQAVTPDLPAQTMEAACRIGARGGGFILEKGVYTETTISPADATSIQVKINGQDAPEARVTREVCSMLLAQVETRYAVDINHQVEVPIGAGYSASAAGAVSTGLALAKALGLRYTLNKIAQFAHTAEIRCATGLGSVSGVVRCGAILILEPGAPGFDRVDWLPLPPSYRIVTASFAPIPKEDIIFSKEALVTVNREGQKVLQRILDEPDLALFMKLCYGFAEKAGFLSDRVKMCIDEAIAAGAIGATQNMIGEAFHALVAAEDVERVITQLTDLLPSQQILVYEVTHGGPRYCNEKP